MKVFKQTIVRYVDADGKRCEKDAPGATKVTEQSANWYGRYTNHKGKRVRVALCRDKQASKQMLVKVIDDDRKAEMGMTDPTATHRAKTLLEHVKDYEDYLNDKGNGRKHVRDTISRCRSILTGCKYHQTEDVEESEVVGYLSSLREQKSLVPKLIQEWYSEAEVAKLFGITVDSVRRCANRWILQGGEGRGQERKYPATEVQKAMERRLRGTGIETTNHYVTSIKGFLRWMVKNHRTLFNPLEHLGSMNAEIDRRHERRALSAEELCNFIQAVAMGSPFRGLTGQDRINLYLVAARTGLRASELASLTFRSFEFDTAKPTLTVKAGYSKHRRKDVLPLHPDLVEVIRQQSEGKEPYQPLWPGSWAEVGAEMIRRDLELAEIPYRDSEERVIDFHGLRHTFLTHLASSGIHPKVAQVLARHSTITLTMDRYTHLQAIDVAGDLEKLPEVSLSAAQKGPSVNDASDVA